MTPEERAAFEARVSDLDSKLGKVREQRHDRDSDQDAEMRGRGMAYGMRMATELVSAVIVGGLIGYALDWWLGTKPWLFLLFFVLGFAAGVLNVLRAYERMQKEFMAKTGGRIGHSVPDDED
jgi:ATP synthase protein I